MVEQVETTFDYVVVGGGLAGCAVAARLSENPDARVILIEAGDENRYEQSYYSVGVHAMFESEANWAFKTVPQPELNNAEVAHPRGKVIGGSAAINIGSWSRGIAADYDAWEAAGAGGWNGKDALSYYEAIETSKRPDGGGRGRRGPMIFEDTPVVSRMTDLLRRACIEAGYGTTEDHNGAKFDGFDLWETIFPYGRRRNSAEAYLRSARVRKNLTVLTRAMTTRIEIAGNRATGVEIERDGQTGTITASREVLLCAGAFGSPQLLMLSGVGPGDHLRTHGIKTVADLPGVGANLIDHLATRLGWAAGSPEGIAPVYGDPSDPSQLETWRHSGTGLLSANPYTSIAFVRSTDEVDLPDIELLFGINPPESLTVDKTVSGFTTFVAHVTPQSRGTVRLASADPHDPPVIDPGYLTDPNDLPVLIAGVRRALALAATQQLRPYTGRYELNQGATDEEIAAWIRSHPVTMFHPVGTTRMGASDDAYAVLDPELRVRGIDGLRVLDVSAMPGIIRGHTMAPALYIAERGAAVIRTGSRM
jgi:choline dehydrogenase-like flavoprotein